MIFNNNMVKYVSRLTINQANEIHNVNNRIDKLNNNHINYQNITDKSIQELKKLTSLDCHWCQNITDKSIRELKNLTSLDCYGCPTCSRLTTLDCNDCQPYN